MPGPLDGIRIVDCSAVVTGPLATVILADQGADVIKIEPPGVGDVTRALGALRGDASTFFELCNRSKRSAAIDLRAPAGREIVEKLVAGADVFVQNFRPGVIDRLGLGEPVLRQISPDLIYVSVSAFGSEGPDATRPVYDHIIQGVSGLAAFQGDPFEQRPQYVKNTICDKVTAYTVAQAITAALLARTRGAGGQHLRISMIDSTLSFLWPDVFSNQTILEDDVAPALPISVTYRFVQATDGFLSVAAVTDAQWHGIFRAVGKPELAEDPRFVTAADRGRNLPALIEALGGGKVEMTMEEALRRLRAEDVPCGPILSLDEVPGDPQVRATGCLVESHHPALGRIRQPRPPARFGSTPAAISRHAPRLGQHTDEVLASIGMSRHEIADAHSKGVVG